MSIQVRDDGTLMRVRKWTIRIREGSACSFSGHWLAWLSQGHRFLQLHLVFLPCSPVNAMTRSQRTGCENTGRLSAWVRSPLP